MDCSTAKCYSHDWDSCPFLQGHIPHALTNWANTPLLACWNPGSVLPEGEGKLSVLVQCEIWRLDTTSPLALVALPWYACRYSALSAKAVKMFVWHEMVSSNLTLNLSRHAAFHHKKRLCHNTSIIWWINLLQHVSHCCSVVYIGSNMGNLMHKGNIQ